MNGLIENTKTRKLPGFWSLTPAQTRIVRRCWQGGGISVWVTNHPGIDKCAAILEKRGVIVKTPSGKEYILTIEAARAIAGWTSDHGKEF